MLFTFPFITGFADSEKIGGDPTLLQALDPQCIDSDIPYSAGALVSNDKARTPGTVDIDL